MEENTSSAGPSEIRFYSWTNPEYRFLSNFYSAPFELEGKRWPTTEHYYQAMKSSDPGMHETIRTCGSPAIAKRYGGMLDTALSAWSERKDDVMRKALRCKFATGSPLAQKLLATGDAKLIEASPNDYYWGEGETKLGKNRLGVLLMEVRDELNAPRPDPDAWLDAWLTD